MEISEYIYPALYILIPVLYFAGMILKSWKKFDDRKIPLTLGILGIILATAYIASEGIPKRTDEIFSMIFAGITQGLLCASGSVYANNIVKQAKKKKDNGLKSEKAGGKGESRNEENNVGSH